MKPDKETQDQFREKILALLNENFKACHAEKNPRATLMFLINENIKKIHGDSAKKRISFNTQKKVHKRVLKELKKRYGPWVTVRILNLKHWEWDTNIGNIYSTDQGRLFGTYLYPDLFFSTHCIERWIERSSMKFYNNFSRAFKSRYNTYPSAIDILIFLIQVPVQVGVSQNNRYVNVNNGIIVLEVKEGIMVAKTFLSHNMAPKARWYKINDNGWLNNLESLIDPKDEQEEKKMVRESINIPADFCYWYFRKLA